MKKEKLEEILKKLGTEEPPADVLEIAEQESRDFEKTLTQSKQPKHLVLEDNIMKIRLIKIAAAAVIAVVVFGGLTLLTDGNRNSSKWWLGPTAAWGQEILGALETIEGVSCREQKEFVTSDGSILSSDTWDILYVSHDSYRRDIYDGDTLREIQWYIPEGNGTLSHSIRFDLESYFIEKGRGSFGNHDPIERMRFYVGLLDEADTLLDEEVIDGHNCVGFEISAAKYGDNPEQWFDCIWFDIETKLPVRIEKHGRSVTGKPDMTFTTIQEQFDYNPELSADTFTPWIPEEFVFGHPDDIKAAEQ